MHDPGAVEPWTQPQPQAQVAAVAFPEVVRDARATREHVNGCLFSTESRRGQVSRGYLGSSDGEYVHFCLATSPLARSHSHLFCGPRKGNTVAEIIPCAATHQVCLDSSVKTRHPKSKMDGTLQLKTPELHTYKRFVHNQLIASPLFKIF